MVRLGWPRQPIAARSSPRSRRFPHLINADKVFGTHKETPERGVARNWHSKLPKSKFPKLSEDTTSIIRAATQYLHNSRLCSRSLDLAHVPMVYSGHMTIVPGDRDCIPTHFGDNAAVIGIASPINAVAFLEAFRFGGLHPHLLIVRSHRQMSF